MLTGNPATADQCVWLFTKLRHEGEQALDALHKTRAEDLIADVASQSRFQTGVSFFLLERPHVLYSIELTGFEVVTHRTHGLVMEYIGCINNPRTKLPEKLRLGVSEERMRQHYVKLG